VPDAVPATLTFEVLLTAKDMRQVATRVIVRLFLILLVVVFIAMAAFRLTRPSTDSWDLISDLLAYPVGLLIGFGITVPFVVMIYANRLARAPQANGPTRYTVSDDGIDLEETNASSRLGWPLFRGFIENKTSIIIHLRERGRLLIVPKRCLSDSQRTALTTILAKKIPQLRVK
jgi:YcxB-like protein